MAKKTTIKKTVKKVAKKKVAAKKEITKKTEVTSIIARVDVGFGNTLYIRGEGAGLNWGKGTALKNTTPYEWVFTCAKTKGDVTFKFLINDTIWAEGENLSVTAGSESISSPAFIW